MFALFSQCFAYINFTVDRVYYKTLNDYEVEVVNGTFDYTYYVDNVTIPSSVTYNNKTYTVVKIGNSAFSSRDKMTSISLPSSLVEIGNGSFSSCKGLTQIILPEGIKKIGSGAFSSTGISNIKIPSSVIELGSEIVGNCPNLSSFVIETGNSNPIEMASQNFGNCSEYGVSIIIGRDIKNHSEYTSPFEAQENIYNISILEGVSSLPYEFIARCPNINSIILPSTIETIGESSFAFCSSLEEIQLSSSLIEIPKTCFSNCSNLKKIHFPSSVISIGESSFEKCTNLSEISFSCGLLKIDKYGFQNCSSLTVLNLPETLQTIGSNAFSGCSSLTEISFGSQVQSFGDWVINGDMNLTTFKINTVEPPYVSVLTFGTNSNIKHCDLIVPSEAVGLYSQSYYWRDFKSISDGSTTSVNNITNNFLSFEDKKIVNYNSYEFEIMIFDVWGNVIFQGKIAPYQSISLPNGIVFISYNDNLKKLYIK